MKINNAFTLVEILIVVLIIGVLTAVVIPKIVDISAKARAQTTEQNLNIIKRCIDLYCSQEGTYPNTLAALTPKYLEKIPKEFTSSSTGSNDIYNAANENDYSITQRAGWIYANYDATSGAINGRLVRIGMNNLSAGCPNSGDCMSCHDTGKIYPLTCAQCHG